VTVDQWLAAARADAARRGLAGLEPLLDTLAEATRALRAADWNAPADAAEAGVAPIFALHGWEGREGPATGVAPARPPEAAPAAAGAAPEPDRGAAALAGAQGASGAAAPDRPGARGGTGAPGAPADITGVAAGAARPIERCSIRQIQPLVASGAVAARDLVEACLGQIAARNAELNAVALVLADRARAEAERADREARAGRPVGPLHGMPITLKDLIDLAGTPTTAASRVRAGIRAAAADAPVVDRLRRAGAIVIGKCNLHEFAFGTTNEDSAFGPARHPADPARSPGGSSGGSAAAVAAGMCAASIGTDTGGSVRIPSAACGLVGLKPAFGEVPVAGVVPLAWSLDHVGPIARCVRDAWLLLDVMAGAEPSPPPPRDGGLAGVRLGVLEPYFCERLDPGVRRAFQAALDRLREAGAQVTPVALPHAALVAPVYLHTVLAEAMAYHAPTLDARPGDYVPAVRLRLELGRYVLAEDYVRAARGRAVLRREIDALLERVDALVLPTLPVPAPRLGESTVEIDGQRVAVRNATLRLTQVFNLTGHPAITLPMGEAAPGLPAGLQLAGRPGATRALLALAARCEDALEVLAAR
jgi:aspartyl-tRNA(Asn)/glutamyl-tRNA(Gln) amidotransferase subunit A